MNRLAAETSPYLLQHRDNPVHWQPWGEAAFAEARRRQVPVLLSTGYAACHWCHVMAHESFEDPAVAAVMNELFVNIKVDREERPDIDTIYQSALALLGQAGGWPLTMFLTPDAEPFWGGTYFPPSARYGRPGFVEVLRGVAAAYRRQPDAVAGNAGALKESLARLSAASPGGVPILADLDRVADGLVRQIDPVHGGLGSAPKFPNAPALALLWRAWLRGGERPFLDGVALTLDRMALGGLYDHLGGGFARYATDDAWLVPHFEKMLYDNAQLVSLYTLAWGDTKSPLYRDRVAGTIAWLHREMQVAGGGFASSLDADSDGAEGRFYVWSEPEIDRLLGAAAPAFKRAYDVRPEGNWEGHTILNRAHYPEAVSQDEEALLARARAILFDARAARPRPGFDDKTLADWNGLTILALVAAALAFRKPDWLASARTTFAYVLRVHGAPGDRLFHSARLGAARHTGLLDDYAQMTAAALALHEATGEASYLAQARAWTAVLDAHFWDAASGGYALAPDDGEPLIARIRNAHDAATPSGNGTAAANLARLYHLTGEDAYRARAAATIAAFSGDLDASHPAAMAYATLLNAAELLQAARQVAIIGDRADKTVQAMLHAVHDLGHPDTVIAVVAPGAALLAGHPAHGKRQVAGPGDGPGDDPERGRATAYVCIGPTCSRPIIEPAALPAALLA